MGNVAITSARLKGGLPRHIPVAQQVVVRREIEQVVTLAVGVES